MKTTNQKNIRFIQILPYLVFFLGTTFFFYWFASYIFYHQEKTSLFITSADFLKRHLDQPGGFLEYLGKLLAAFYYPKLLGPVLTGLIISGSIYLLSQTGKLISGKSAYVFPFLTGAAMVYLQANYQYAAFNNLSIFLQLLAFYLTNRFFHEKWNWIVVFLFPAWYFLTGGFSWIFLLLFLLQLVVKHEKNWWLKILIGGALTAMCFYFGMQFLFFETPETLLLHLITAMETGMQVKEFIVLIFLVLMNPPAFRLKFNVKGRKMNSDLTLGQIVPYIIIVGLALALIPRVDKKNSHYYHVEELFYKQEYQKVIAFNEAFPSTNMLTIFLNNIALTETGQLTSRLFEFPQSPDGGTLFLKWEIMGEVLRRGGYFYYTVGMINEANRWAYEYMVMRGYTPEVLKMLIKTELINGNYRVAEKYISILKKSIYYRSEARNFEKLLFDDEAVNAHPDLGAKKRIKAKTDFFVRSDEPAANLEYLIASDSNNIPALEYWFAWRLLQKDVEGAAQNLPLLEKFGYRQIPRHIQEAAAGYKMLQMGPFPELDYLKIDPGTEQRFRQYYQVFQQNNVSKEQAQRALYPNFHDTFWYYLFFK
jgi:hypothetical protein